jgi:hypothetical protein
LAKDICVTTALAMIVEAFHDAPEFVVKKILPLVVPTQPFVPFQLIAALEVVSPLSGGGSDAPADQLVPPFDVTPHRHIPEAGAPTKIPFVLSEGK